MQAVLFDIDGVLIDSFEANHAFISGIFKKAGFPAYTKEQFAPFVHLSLVDFFKQHISAKDTEKAEALIELAVTEPYPNELLVKPDAADATLAALKEQYRLGVVSSRRAIGIQWYFDFAKNQNLFDVTVGYEDTLSHKPHPEPLLLAAQRLGLSASQCAYVGDTPFDVEATKSAGMHAIIFGGKTHAAADAATSRFDELPALIAKFQSHMAGTLS